MPIHSIWVFCGARPGRNPAHAEAARDTGHMLARNDWRNVLSNYLRDHPLFNDPDLMAAMSLTSNQIDALWTLGTQQPA